jgi:tagatose 1,6-diphosphate aldolase
MNSRLRNHSNSRAPGIDPGKMRSFQRVVLQDGFFLICALDHLSDFQELLDSDPKTVDYARTVDAKLDLIRAMASEVSAFLLDPRFALAQVIAARALPASMGFMSSIEDEGYYGSVSRMTRLRAGWGTRKIKLIGADVCKLLWFFRPNNSTADFQRGVLKRLVAECAALSLPLVVEPIWYPLPEEDPTKPEWKARRIEGIIESAHEANSYGVDMLKVEFPGDVSSEEGQGKALDSCKRLDTGINVPWVILSAGVSYDSFKKQVEISCKAGASGYLAGRSIWRDAASTHDPKAKDGAVAGAIARLAELNAITRVHGRPYLPTFSGTALHETLPEFWYEGWHP